MTIIEQTAEEVARQKAEADASRRRVWCREAALRIYLQASDCNPPDQLPDDFAGYVSDAAALYDAADDLPPRRT